MSSIKQFTQLALCLIALDLAAEDDLPDSLKDSEPMVIMSAGFGLMKLSTEEKEKFGKIIGEFTDDVRSAVFLESGRNEPLLERRIERRVDKLFRHLDERVEPFVNETNEKGYAIFKAGLERQMHPRNLNTINLGRLNSDPPPVHEAQIHTR